jgi:hypothetical protein
MIRIEKTEQPTTSRLYNVISYAAYAAGTLALVSTLFLCYVVRPRKAKSEHAEYIINNAERGRTISIGPLPGERNLELRAFITDNYQNDESVFLVKKFRGLVEKSLVDRVEDGSNFSMDYTIQVKDDLGNKQIYDSGFVEAELQYDWDGERKSHKRTEVLEGKELQDTAEMIMKDIRRCVAKRKARLEQVEEHLKRTKEAHSRMIKKGAGIPGYAEKNE